MQEQIDDTLQENLDYFIQNQNELVEKYRGKALVIKNRQVVGVYDEPLEAYLAASKKFEPGTFSLQPCSAGVEAYSVTINPILVDA